MRAPAAALSSLVLLASGAAAASNVTLEHAGFLLGDGDQPLTAAGFSMVFSLWSDATGTSGTLRVWGPVTCSVDVDHGYYQVALGGGGAGACGTGLTHAELPVAETRWLEVTAGGVVLSPRLRIEAVPAAVNADLLDGLHGASYMRTDASTATSGALSVGGALGVAGASTFTSAAFSSGVTVASTLGVTGAATLGGPVSLGSTLAVTGAATLTGAVSVGSTLGVAGAATFQAPVTLASSLAVGGAATLGSTLSVAGATTLGGALTVAGTETVNGGVLTLNAGSHARVVLNSGSSTATLDNFPSLTLNPGRGEFVHLNYATGAGAPGGGVRFCDGNSTCNASMDAGGNLSLATLSSAGAISAGTSLGAGGALTVGGGITAGGGLALGGSLAMGGQTAIDAGAGWHRSYGATGWFNGTYSGGWYMTDTTWIRSYNSKNVYIDQLLRADGGLQVGSGGSAWNLTSGGSSTLAGNETVNGGVLTVNAGGHAKLVLTAGGSTATIDNYPALTINAAPNQYVHLNYENGLGAANGGINFCNGHGSCPSNFDASGNLTVGGTGSVGGALTTGGTATVNGGTASIIAGSHAKLVLRSGSSTATIDNYPHLTVNPGANEWVHLNYSTGSGAASGGTRFCDGNGTCNANVDSAGNITTNAGLNVSGGTTGIVDRYSVGWIGCQPVNNFRRAGWRNVLVHASLYTASNCTGDANDQHACHTFCASQCLESGASCAGCCGVATYYTNGCVDVLYYK